MVNATEKRSTITLAAVLLLLVALFALNATASFVEGKGLFGMRTLFDALRLPMLLAGSAFIVVYASGYLKENLKRVSISATVYALLFLLGEILIFFLSIFISFVVFKADVQEIFSVFTKVLLWVLLFILMIKRIERPIDGVKCKHSSAHKVIPVVIACLFVVSFVVVQHVVLYPALEAGMNVDAMSQLEMIDFMTSGGNGIISLYRSIELFSWWVLAAACIWWRYPKDTPSN